MPRPKTKATHTPGPWTWTDEHGDPYDDWSDDFSDPGEPPTGIPETLRGAGCVDILRYQEWTDTREDGAKTSYRLIGVSEPDARLIAAAPDLLESLKKLSRIARDIFDHDAAPFFVELADLEQAEAAIAKAGAK